MVEVISVVLIIAGLVLLFGGAALSVYGIALLGMAVGGGIGYVSASTVGGIIGVEGLLATVVSVGIGVLFGAILAKFVLSMAVSILGFVVGMFFGRAVIAPAIFDAAWYVEWGIGLLVGIAAAMAAMAFTRTVLILVTSAVGATLASREVTMSSLELAQSEFSIDPLTFDPIAPIFLGLFILGVLTQVGLFKLGYVTKLAKRIPGMRMVTDRGRAR